MKKRDSAVLSFPDEGEAVVGAPRQVPVDQIERRVADAADEIPEVREAALSGPCPERRIHSSSPATSAQNRRVLARPTQQRLEASTLPQWVAPLGPDLDGYSRLPSITCSPPRDAASVHEPGAFGSVDGALLSGPAGASSEAGPDIGRVGAVARRRNAIENGVRATGVHEHMVAR